MRSLVSSRVALWAAGALGAMLRRLGDARNALVELAGVCLVAYGLGLAWYPLAWIALGAAALLVGWRRA